MWWFSDLANRDVSHQTELYSEHWTLVLNILYKILNADSIYWIVLSLLDKISNLPTVLYSLSLSYASTLCIYSFITVPMEIKLGSLWSDIENCPSQYFRFQLDVFLCADSGAVFSHCWHFPEPRVRGMREERSVTVMWWARLSAWLGRGSALSVHSVSGLRGANHRWDESRVLGAWPTTSSTQQTNSGYC